MKAGGYVIILKIRGLGTKKGAKSRNGFMKSFQALHKRRKGFLSMIL